MERWERAALLFDAENIVTLSDKLKKDEVVFHPLDRFLDFDSYEALARWMGPTQTEKLTLRLRRKEAPDLDIFDRHAAAFFLGDNFIALPLIENGAWFECAYYQDIKPESTGEAPATV